MTDSRTPAAPTIPALPAIGAISDISKRPLRLAVCLACVLASCKGWTLAGSGGDSGSLAVDAGSDVRVAGFAPGIDAAPPPDDAIFPQTGEELTVRARHLLEAIVQDDAGLAADILFPRDAWLATRDAADLGKDWDVHVATPFRKTVHALSRRHGNLNQMQAVSIELGGALTEATPRRHGWKKPLWTVSGSRLTFVVDGHTRTLPIREMVAWRGAWYVTRLR